jgi:GT2 family glycosyltransferase
MVAPKLSIVFLNFNRVQETRFTIAHLRSILVGQNDCCEVIAVDNGSSDGTGAFLQSQADFLTPVLLTENEGIAGYNRGFELSRGEYILVLDDDSHPVNRETLDRLIARLDDNPQIGLLACGIDDKDGRTVTSWHLPQDGAAGPSMSFIGCGFAIRRELFAACGWYPAHFFLYQNEIEVAMQVRMRGFSIHYAPDCRVVHRVAASNRGSWRQVFYATRNSLWLIRSHYAGLNRFYLLLSRVMIGFIRALQLKQLPAYGQGLQAGLRTPIKRQVLPAAIADEFKPFWRQNSLWHQFLRLT